MAQSREEPFEYRGAQIHLDRGGEGAPLLYIHHSGGGRFWNEFHESLSDDYEVIAPDLPGFSRSPRPDWLDDIDDVVLFALDLMEALGFERYSVVGESLGGWVAGELAIHHPERLDRLVLMAPIGLYQPEEPYVDFLTLNTEEQVQAYFHDPAVAARAFPAEPSEDEIMEMYENNSTTARLAWAESYSNRKLRDRLYRVTPPTLLLWGDDDKAVPRSYATLWEELVPNASLELVNACGHAISLEQPVAAGEKVLAFLRSTAPVQA
jgi:pimeloyl-ACP methyl ester carboxylesterase